MADYSIQVAIPNQGPKGDTGEVPEAPEDATPYARKDGAWTPTVSLEENGSINAIVQVRQGTAAELGEIVLNDGELAIELEGGVPKQLKVGDGTTAGGVAPSINDWTILQGTSNDDQNITNSTTLQNISLFEAHTNLVVGGIYQFNGRANFKINDDGGIRVSSANLDAPISQSFVRTVSGDWGEQKYTFLIEPTLVESDYLDAGSIVFQGSTQISAGANNNRFRLRFAQATATANGSVDFLGSGSFLAYRRLA